MVSRQSDRTGTRWKVFDREAARQRAFPQHRLEKGYAPGETGRTRGETVCPRPTVVHAQESPWLDPVGTQALVTTARGCATQEKRSRPLSRRTRRPRRLPCCGVLVSKEPEPCWQPYRRANPLLMPERSLVRRRPQQRVGA